MEHITSRKNRIITHLRALSSDGDYRRQCGEYLCDGVKTLREALDNGAEITTVLWGGEPQIALPDNVPQLSCPEDLMQNVSPLKSSKGPVFTIKMQNYTGISPKSMIILESVQDPGNVGTVIRTAGAMDIDLVVLVGDCADLYNPKTVRSTMGAIFRQPVIETDLEGIKDLIKSSPLKLYGAALSDGAVDIRMVDITNIAVSIGSEGRGLSREMLDLCDGQLIIPMQPQAESLNAAVAASIVMWEQYRRREDV